MPEPVTSDRVRFRRPRLVPGVELVSVCYRERRFPEHSHGEYVVGAVVAGAETLAVAGRSHRVDAGMVLRLHPEEAHANATVGADALRYDVLYLREEVVRRYVGHDRDRDRDRDRDGATLRFRSPVSGDPALFAAVAAAHAVLGRDAGRLEGESALAALVRALAVEGCGGPVAAGSRRAHAAGIAEAKAYVDAHYADGFGLHELAALSGLSVFHFTRSFKKATGLSPLAYRNGRRVAEARRRLLDGQPIAQVALATGYADQSHLTRQFQRIVGVSPRRYAQQ